MLFRVFIYFNNIFKSKKFNFKKKKKRGEGSSYAPVIHESDSEEDDLARMERKKKEIQKLTGEDTHPGEGKKNNKRKPVRKNKTAKKPKVT